MTKEKLREEQLPVFILHAGKTQQYRLTIMAMRLEESRTAPTPSIELVERLGQGRGRGYRR